MKKTIALLIACVLVVALMPAVTASPHYSIVQHVEKAECDVVILVGEAQSTLCFLSCDNCFGKYPLGKEAMVDVPCSAVSCEMALPQNRGNPMPAVGADTWTQPHQFY